MEYENLQLLRNGAGELVKLMGASAWHAPGSADTRMAEAITRNQKKALPCCVKLEDEFELENIFVGVPVVLGKNRGGKNLGVKAQ